MATKTLSVPAVRQARTASGRLLKVPEELKAQVRHLRYERRRELWELVFQET